MLYRHIISTVSRDTRLLSLVTQSGIKNTLITMLDQLQRCQKSLNEFLEVCENYVNTVHLLEFSSCIPLHQRCMDFFICFLFCVMKNCLQGKDINEFVHFNPFFLTPFN